MKQLTGPLTERYRPETWADVVGQEKVVGRILALAKRGTIAGRAYWLSGQSGTGKTTIARLLAAEVACDCSGEQKKLWKRTKLHPSKGRTVLTRLKEFEPYLRPLYADETTRLYEIVGFPP
jgi:Holliday junction resolvasome RuvABC ATP-dependent DNA helicase subunit